MKIEDRRKASCETITGHKIPRDTVFFADSLIAEQDNYKISNGTKLYWKTVEDKVINLSVGTTYGLFFIAHGYVPVKVQIVVDE